DGAFIQLEISGIPTTPTTLVAPNVHFHTAAARRRWARDPARFDARDPILGALFQLESPEIGPPPAHLLPRTPHYDALRAAYDRDPAQFQQRKRVYLGAILALESIENGGRSAL